MKWQYGGAGKQTRLHTTRRSTVSLVLLKILLYTPLRPSKRHNIKNEHERRKRGVCIFLFPLSSDLHMESFFFFFPFLALYKQINTITSFLCILQTFALFSIICSSLLLSCRTFACCFSTLFLHPSLLIHPSNHP